MDFRRSQSFIKKIRGLGIKKEKLVFWPQYAEEFYCKYEGKEEVKGIPQDGELNLTFAGNVGFAQGLEVLVQAAKILKEKGEYVRFNIIGDGRYMETFKKEIQIANVPNYFNFIGRKPATDIPKYFAKSDASLITLGKSEVFAMTIPAKVQSSMACGMPIIASIDGEAKDVIAQAKCGYCGKAASAEQLVDNIMKFKNCSKEKREEFSQNAMMYFKKNYEKGMLLDKIEVYLK